MPLNRRTFIAATLAGALLGPRALAQETGDLIRVATSLGTLRGRAGGGVRSFLGVPFAQPPIGSLRFRPPQRAQPWNGVRDALAFAPEAEQSGIAPMSEDCLYLNIWAPDDAGPHPVMVWIYGGGNIGGSTRDPLFDGASFARSGVICVTVGYRVGALGFMELGGLLGPQYAGSGNNGLLDCIDALRWVQTNIEPFGGDPNRVTVFGQSAGAKNVAALLATPAAGGLFRQAIMESGGGSTVQTQEGARDVAQRLLAAIGLRATPADAAHLLTAPVDTLLSAQAEMARAYPHAFPFRAVIGGTLLPRAPVEMIAQGASRNVSLILGTNRDESLFFFPASEASQPIGSREIANITPAEMAAQQARYEAAFPKWPALRKRVRALTAEEYWIPTLRVADAHSTTGGATRLYRFEYASDLPHYRKYGDYAVHTSELPFVWNHLPPDASPADNRLAALLHGAWASFAATGTAAAAGLPQWPAYDSGARKTLAIGLHGEPSIVSDPAGDERQLWNGLL